MSTRGSVGVILDNKYKATYNHSDSYPDGLGVEVVEFVNRIVKENGFERMKDAVKKLKLVSNSKKPTKAQIEKYKQFSNTGVSTGELTEWYVLLRELQGVEVFVKCYEGIVQHMIDSSNFIKDSLFCEWAYIINLDTMKLEVYEGFQKIPDPNNRFGQTNDEGYYPCKMIASFPMNKKISEKTFLKKLDSKN